MKRIEKTLDLILCFAIGIGLAGSTGRVWTDQGEFFPSVFGLHWKEGNYAN